MGLALQSYLPIRFAFHGLSPELNLIPLLFRIAHFSHTLLLASFFLETDRNFYSVFKVQVSFALFVVCDHNALA